MISCPTCRKQLEDNSTICPFCGTKLAGTKAPPLAAPQGVSSGAPGQAPTPGQPNPSLSLQKAPYGQQPQQQAPYGQQPQQQAPYGQQPQQQAPYGRQPQQAPYGQQPQQAYASPHQAPYGQQPQQAYPPYGQGVQQQYAASSPKKRNIVILLCYFLGLIGVHRFYLGKVVTAILMVITAGGLGIWWLIDFFISIFGNYTDSQKRPVVKKYSKPLAIVLILFGVVGPIAAASLFVIPFKPNFIDYYHVNIVKSACFEVSFGELMYFKDHNAYTTSYDGLRGSFHSMEFNPEVNYGDIELVTNPQTGEPGFKFIMSNKSMPKKIRLEYDSTVDTIEKCQ